MGMLVPGVTLAELERMRHPADARSRAAAPPRKAAEMLGISRRKIQYRLKEWGMNDSSAGDDDGGGEDE